MHTASFYYRYDGTLSCHLNHVQHLKYIRTVQHTLLRYKRTPLTTLHPFILFMKAALTPILQKP